MSKNDKVLYAILYNTLEDQLASTSLGESKPEEDKKKAKGMLTCGRCLLFNNGLNEPFRLSGYSPIDYQHT